jgi:hypothetical protein
MHIYVCWRFFDSHPRRGIATIHNPTQRFGFTSHIKKTSLLTGLFLLSHHRTPFTVSLSHSLLILLLQVSICPLFLDTLPLRPVLKACCNECMDSDWVSQGKALAFIEGQEFIVLQGEIIYSTRNAHASAFLLWTRSINGVLLPI